MTDERSLWGLPMMDARRAHDIGDVCDLILDKYAWRSPSGPRSRPTGGAADTSPAKPSIANAKDKQ